MIKDHEYSAKYATLTITVQEKNKLHNDYSYKFQLDDLKVNSQKINSNMH